MLKFKWHTYPGSLTRGKMPLRVARAYAIIQEQRGRCNRSNHRRYSTYGAKGVRVRYSSHDFIGWYLAALKLFTGKNPHVARKNHALDYCFENIELQSAVENTAELFQRFEGGPGAKLDRRKVRQIRRELKRGVSGRAIGKKFGVHESTVSYIKSGKTWL